MMDNKRSTFMIVLAVAVLVLASLACSLISNNVQVGPLQTESQTVPMDDAEAVSVEIDLGAGELTMGGGAARLLEADFTYNVSELKPEVNYSGGTLSVRTPNVGTRLTSLLDVDDFRYEWDLRLNDSVPMEMVINVGAGRSDLDLGGLTLTRLNVNSGAGEVMLDLAGNSSLNRLDVEVGAGAVTVDLSGDWQNDLDASIQAGVGELTIRLPANVGVRVDIGGGLGDVSASDLTRDGDTYINSAYGESAVSIRVDIQAGIGKINLDLGE